MVGTVEEFRKAIIRELHYVQVTRIRWPIIVAWSNNRGREPAVVSIDLRNRLESEMKSCVLLAYTQFETGIGIYPNP